MGLFNWFKKKQTSQKILPPGEILCLGNILKKPELPPLKFNIGDYVFVEKSKNIFWFGEVVKIINSGWAQWYVIKVLALNNNSNFNFEIEPIEIMISVIFDRDPYNFVRKAYNIEVKNNE